jgi:hypothetical protein
MPKAKVCILDIETAPKIAYVWRFFKENVGAKQVLEHGHIMSFAAKFLGDDHVYYEENRSSDDKKIVESLLTFLDGSDIIVAHNAKGFDLPSIRGRALVHGLEPPSPYSVVDTLLEARRNFKFESNSLEYLAKILGCSEKLSHKDFPGFELWLECLRDNDEAWAEMMQYNIQDVETLEEVYLKMRPWMGMHPNVGVFSQKDRPICPKCGSEHIHYRGYAYTNVSKFRKFQCKECGAWGRSRHNEYPKAIKSDLSVPVR